MSTEKLDRFPPELLSASKAERFAYFESWIMDHRKLVEVQEELLRAIRYAGERRIICLYGCTGTGKSTVCTRVQKAVTEEAWAAMEQDPDLVPITSVRTRPPDRGSFDWRELYEDTLRAFGEPRALVARKKPIRPQFVTDEQLAQAPPLRRQELRLAMANCLQSRRVKVLVLDEAQHLQYVTKTQRLESQLDNLKWLADVTDTTIVLIGTYDLLNLIDLSGQLARRSTSIHFGRYHADDPVEWHQFSSAVYTFQRHLPLARAPQLVKHYHYLYERSLGCIGLLKEWLLEALGKALDHDEETLTLKRLDGCVDFGKLQGIAHEAVEGDERASTRHVLSNEFRQLVKSASAFPAARPTAKQQPPASKAKGKPGKRKPKRDPVEPTLSEAV